MYTGIMKFHRRFSLYFSCNTNTPTPNDISYTPTKNEVSYLSTSTNASTQLLCGYNNIPAFFCDGDIFCIKPTKELRRPFTGIIVALIFSPWPSPCK